MIGEDNVIEEQTIIRNPRAEGTDDCKGPPMIIGNFNLFEVGCSIVFNHNHSYKMKKVISDIQHIQML